MKRTRIEKIPIILPREIENLSCGAEIYDSSCSPEARVYLIDCGEKMYLKCAEANTLRREAEMTEYFHKKGLGAEVLSYISLDKDFLLTKAVSGEDCTHEMYLSQPQRLCDLLAYKLRQLHEMDFSNCPVKDRVGEYLQRAVDNYKADSYNKEHFPDSFGYRSGEEAYSVITKYGSMLKNEVLLHGDYCLPNIMLDNWKFSAFIDLDSSGIGDRHIDLFWGRWTMEFNLKTDKYNQRFLDAYGRDKIDADKLRIVAAGEVLA